MTLRCRGTAAFGPELDAPRTSLESSSAPPQIVPLVRSRAMAGTGDCKTATCPADVNGVCPSDLQKKGSDGSVVACLSACVKFNQPQYCCTPPQNTPETCPPTNYSQIFSQACPNAYSYAYDDNKGTFTCNGGPNYAITFCP
ncbi:unnamed protein product [Prunus armeniaca]